MARGGRRRVVRRVVGVVGAVVALGVVAGGVLRIWAPWAPEVVVTEPGPSGEWLQDRDLTAHWYPAPGASSASPGPGVLLVGGSDGGLSEPAVRQAVALQDEGFSVLALAYFGAPGQQEDLVDVPLETFEAGLDRLAGREEVDPARLAMMGGSKGAEAALLVAAGRPDLRAVVATMPSGVVWQGLDLQRPWRMVTAPGSSWSRDGRPLPYLALGSGGAGGEMSGIYASALEDAAERPEVLLPVEDVAASVLLTCGGLDRVWPSCPMAHDVVGRAAAAGRDVVLVEHPDAGHVAQGPPRAVPAGLAEQLGGTSAANEAAMEESWPRVLEHLRVALA